METAESRSRAVGTELEQEVARLEVGFWTPAGPFLRDDLFPHVKGNFRRRVIPVASVHVSNTLSLGHSLGKGRNQEMALKNGQSNGEMANDCIY